jgi:Arc/MetJ family transcription regulator
MMVDLDDALLEEAQRLSRARTRKATIEVALRELVRRRKSMELAGLAGTVDVALTQQDLRAMREGR